MATWEGGPHLKATSISGSTRQKPGMKEEVRKCRRGQWPEEQGRGKDEWKPSPLLVIVILIKGM